jgi:hypothetical protein
LYLLLSSRQSSSCDSKGNSEGNKPVSGVRDKDEVFGSGVRDKNEVFGSGDADENAVAVTAD